MKLNVNVPPPQISILEMPSMKNHYFLAIFYFSAHGCTRLTTDESISKYLEIDEDEYIKFTRENFDALEYDHLYYYGIENAKNAEEWVQSIILAQCLSKN